MANQAEINVTCTNQIKSNRTFEKQKKKIDKLFTNSSTA